jgi:hypothetical protein
VRQQLNEFHCRQQGCRRQISFDYADVHGIFSIKEQAMKRKGSMKMVLAAMAMFLLPALFRHQTLDTHELLP